MRRGAERGGAVRTCAELGEALRHLRGGTGREAGRRGLRGVGSGLAGLCRAGAGAGNTGALPLYPVPNGRGSADPGPAPPGAHGSGAGAVPVSFLLNACVAVRRVLTLRWKINISAVLLHPADEVCLYDILVWKLFEKIRRNCE